MKKVSEGQLRNGVEACASAKSSSCKCPCGGRFHGQEHPEDWIQQILREGPPKKPLDSIDFKFTLRETSK